MMKKLFIFFAIGLIGFTLCLSFTGCKKHKAKDVSASEEKEDDDSEDDSEDSE
jgi:hypothetical protein